MFKSFVKTLASVTLCIVLLMSVMVVSAQTAEQTYSISDLAGKYKTQGRTAVVGGKLMLDWSASGMVFKANCSGDVKITVEGDRVRSGSKGGIYFTVIVDGVVQHEDKRIPSNNATDSWTSNSTGYPFHIISSGERTFTIATGLSSGEHTFEIYKQTEAQYTSFGIKSITLNGTVSSAPLNNDLYIEFVGDSITAGLGNLSTGGSNADTSLHQDATRGWAYLTAKELGADWSIIAQTGITATKGIGWAGANSLAMPDVYPKLRYYSDKSTNYNFSRQPDVVVIALGTNDIWTSSDTAKIKQGFKDFLALIKSKNPGAKIVWVYGMMRTDANSLITSVINDAGGATAGYYALELSLNKNGGQGHPNLAVQAEYANDVASFIENTVLDNSSSPGSSSSGSSSSNSSSSSNNSSSSSNNSSSSSNSSSVSSSGAASDNSGSSDSASSNGTGSKPGNNSNKTDDSSSDTEVLTGTDGNSSGGLSSGLIIGIIVCSVALLAWIAIIVYFIVSKKKKAN